MMPSFIIALSSHMSKLDSALQSGDLEILGRAGHTMKGALLNLGLHDSVSIALEIEQKGKSQDESADYQALLESLRKNLDVLLA